MLCVRLYIYTARGIPISKVITTIRTMSKQSKELNKNYRSFLKTFFEEEGYQEKEVNGYWLVKSVNGETEREHVSLYTQASYKRYKGFTENTLFEQQ